MNPYSPLRDKSYQFAIKVVRLSQTLVSIKKEFVLSKQVLRSGSAIGALIREAEFASSKKDFISKMAIALKEANKIVYWLMLLKDTDYLSIEEFNKLEKDCKELVAMLVASIKTSKGVNLSVFILYLLFTAMLSCIV